MDDIDVKLNLKLMIVDDEYLMRQGIKIFFNWMDYGISNVIEAESSVSAIRMSMSEKPDIIITDIRMPEINGLELVRKLKEIIPDAAFIIISGYDDFNYAKQAISLGVQSYLVKPIVSSELHDSIKHCIEDIGIKRKQKVIENEFRKKTEESMDIIRDSLMRTLVNGTYNVADNDIVNNIQESKIDIIDEFYIATVIKANNFQKLSRTTTCMIHQLLKNGMINYFNSNDILQGKHYNLIDSSEFVSIISFSDHQTIKEYLSTCFKNLYSDIKKMYDIDLIFSVGKIVDNIFELQFSYKDALFALDNKLLANESGILFADEINTIGSSSLYPVFTDNLKKLVDGIEKNAISDIQQSVADIKNAVKKLGYISRSYLYTVILETLVSTVKSFTMRGFSLEEIYDVRIFSYEFISKFHTIDDAFSWLDEFFCKMSDFIMGCRINKPERAIAEIKEYIKNNINDDISLSSISEKFYYNPSYLSRLFKKVMKSNFSDYIHELRIDMAKDLLVNTDLSINQICVDVGYKDCKYFHMLFKKLTKNTPANYRYINRK